ncbi:MAG: hypothetical protein J0H92_00855 [Sphingobacteriales bacterium]|nr:hypothetical protein [Sphingobacteriales bacterium]OJW35408.1 MAG: hypothetical protein BGO54_02250 [Sphingobacteriales bacterium 46-32]
MRLKKYWIEFEINRSSDYPIGIGYGCGVTAYSMEDVVSILNIKIFKTVGIPPIKKIVEDVDIQELDQNHVLANMKSPIFRGVWFPLGYD